MGIMSEKLSFSQTHNYDTTKKGITVPVLLRTGADSLQLSAKLDTGSSFCIFERKHGERLGFDIESGTPTTLSTVTGKFLAYGHEVTIVVLGIEFQSTVYFAADENFTRNVLGRQGWLDRMRLGIIDYEGKLFLSDYND
jgi:predicted aspartyl protease